jgi:hypothetical protein
VCTGTTWRESRVDSNTFFPNVSDRTPIMVPEPVLSEFRAILSPRIGASEVQIYSTHFILFSFLTFPAGPYTCCLRRKKNRFYYVAVISAKLALLQIEAYAVPVYLKFTVKKCRQIRELFGLHVPAHHTVYGCRYLKN